MKSRIHADRERIIKAYGIGGEMKRALIVVDLQNDFCAGGSLAVTEGEKLTVVINKIMKEKKFDVIVATQDFHPANHCSFKSNGGIWPDHCVTGAYGAELRNDLDQSKINLILRKGMNSEVDSYSAFFDNDHKTDTGLLHYLGGLGIEEVYICGLATDYCVAFSALDAKLHFDTFVLTDACRGVDLPAGNLFATLENLAKNNVKLINSSEIK